MAAEGWWHILSEVEETIEVTIDVDVDVDKIFEVGVDRQVDVNINV